MQKSLLYQLGQKAAGLFERIVEEVVLAEELGLESIWCLPEAGEVGDFRLGAPEVWLAALAGRTERIRLGWGLAGLTPPARAPIRTAEQAASIDLASAGRLDLALLPAGTERGEGDSDAESPASGSPAPWDEGFRMLIDMWDGPRFSWTSARFEVPPIDVLPKPVQKPHPPIWLIGWSLDDARRAGASGLGYLDVSGGDDEVLEMHRDGYVASRAGADPDDLASASAFAAVMALAAGADSTERLAHWAALGFDQAVLRIDPLDDPSEKTREQIRFFAERTAEMH